MISEIAIGGALFFTAKGQNQRGSELQSLLERDVFWEFALVVETPLQQQALDTALASGLTDVQFTDGVTRAVILSCAQDVIYPDQVVVVQCVEVTP